MGKHISTKPERERKTMRIKQKERPEEVKKKKGDK